MGKTVSVEWTPGHAGIQGNDAADALAKEAAMEASKLDQDRTVLTILDIIKASRDTITTKWQLRWNFSERGRHMYALHPKISSASKTTTYPSTSSYRDIVQLRTGYSRLNGYRYKTGAATTPSCSCGHSEETVEHYLLECANHESERDAMLLKLHRATGIQNLSLELLLSCGPDDPFLEDRSKIVLELSNYLDATERLRPASSPSAM